MDLSKASRFISSVISFADKLGERQKIIAIALLVAIIAGTQLFAYAPYDFKIISLLGLACFYYILSCAKLRDGLIYVGIYAFVLHISVMHWVYYSISYAGEMGALSSSGIVALMSIGQVMWFLPPFFLFLYFKDLVSPIERAFLFGFALFFSEILRFIEFYGTPWVGLEYVYLDTWLAYYAPFIGGLGIAFLVSFGVASLVEMVNISRRSKIIVLSAIAGVVVLGALLQLTIKEQVNLEKKFGIAQGNTDVRYKWTNDKYTNLTKYLNLSMYMWYADLILWPESSVGFMYREKREFFESYADTLQNASLIVGMLDRIPIDTDPSDTKIVNSAFLVGKDTQAYYKKRLVPAGEETPWILLFLTRLIGFPVSAIEPDDRGVNLMELWGQKLMPIMCYESAYPIFLAMRNGGDANLLINFSDDAWFGTSVGPHQHLAINRMRSLESGLYNIRATNNGITALISPSGEVVSSVRQFIETTFVTKVKMLSSKTLYMIFPHLMVVLLLIGAGGVVYRYYHRKRC